ncbi:hypothetical protein HK105_204225 [Polyrhizophydium stewartii]|uniref:Uncharacterized protein n=1 Tax=Polyrhizophydium stewartii TaxID=2732419 RepID=A0ABR4N9E2_9FUNG
MGRVAVALAATEARQQARRLRAVEAERAAVQRSYDDAVAALRAERAQHARVCEAHRRQVRELEKQLREMAAERRTQWEETCLLRERLAVLERSAHAAGGQDTAAQWEAAVTKARDATVEQLNAENAEWVPSAMGLIAQVAPLTSREQADAERAG